MECLFVEGFLQIVGCTVRLAQFYLNRANVLQIFNFDCLLILGIDFGLQLKLHRLGCLLGGLFGGLCRFE